MESFSGELLLALTPEQRGRLRGRRCTPVWLCYSLRNGPRLWRCAAPETIRGGVLMAEDSAQGELGDPALCCAQAVRECEARGAAGFWANWEHPPSPAREALTARLERSLQAAGRSLYVNEPYAACTESARVLISSALSGGTLEARLTEALERYGRPRLVLAVERVAEAFCLPAPSGRGEYLTPGQVEALRRRHGARVHRSRELCESYFTYQDGEQTRLVLFDTDEDVREKLRLAQRLGLERVLLALEELGGLA